MLCCTLLLCAPALLFASQNSGSGPAGIFEGQNDLGSVTPPGTTAFDPAQQTYTVTAAGDDIWSSVDDFHFVWKKVSGDVSLTADMEFPDSTGSPNPHRKAVLMFRQTLDAGGIYVDAAQHGSGMTALQYRRAEGADTQDIELDIASPKRVRIEKRGDTFTMFLSLHGEPLHQVGTSIQLHLDGTFYAGIGVCSHNTKASDRVIFSHVELTPLTSPAAPAKMALYSTLQTIRVAERFRSASVVYTTRGRIEAPNWSRDGSYLVFDEDGHLMRIDAKGGAPTQIDTGAATRCNGSHGFSPDGKWLAISCSMPDQPKSRVYVIPAAGGTPRVVTENPNSYFHSWSPDGKTILFTRPAPGGGGNIYAIPAEGGEEHALTSGSGISDDPDFSPDGKYIYFNSDRSGGMQIWRMRADGSHPEQMVFNDLPNWTAHPSPDGKSVIFFSYEKGVAGHPVNKNIALRILSPESKAVRLLVNLIGGSGTMNVPSWSPDSSRMAFVSYQMLPEDDRGSSE
ncbi:TolB family protein [Paracidobacterium acidisoli]|nr:PD40 domain-containing protein [Paracidobacterium acidisoli]MBT9329417.1 hypothetical protein [Paracidobacterium acidisoli]